MTFMTKGLAGRARVLTAAVCRALMNDPKVRPKVRDLILSLFSQLENKPPNILAGNFARKKTNITGIALPEAVLIVSFMNLSAELMKYLPAFWCR